MGTSAVGGAGANDGAGRGSGAGAGGGAGIEAGAWTAGGAGVDSGAPAPTPADGCGEAAPAWGALAGAFVVAVALLEPVAAPGASAAEARTNDTINPRAITVASKGLKIGVVRSAGAIAHPS